MKLKYVYHVVYCYANNDNNSLSGYGSITIYKRNKLDTEEEVEDLVKFIKNENNLDNVIIQNFILLNKRGKK